MKNWKDEEVKALFKKVEETKISGEPLVSAFAAHAQAFKRKPNSVRNYYYHEVDALGEDKKRCLRLGISIQKHDKTHFQGFDKVQENELFEKIEKLLSQGMSVRSACLKLSGGDLPLMTRYQNKYQNMKRKVEGKKAESENKVIPFVQRKTLSDGEINSLFLGLVKLIRKNATDEAFEKSREVEISVKRAFATIAEKDSEINSLLAEIKTLKAQNAELKRELKSAVLAKHIQNSKHLKDEKQIMDKR